MTVALGAGQTAAREDPVGAVVPAAEVDAVAAPAASGRTSAAALPPALALPAGPRQQGLPLVVPDPGPARLDAPPPAPPGTGGYAFLGQGSQGPVTWDPCRPVRWVVRQDGAPPGAKQRVADAFAELGAATGLRFVDAGGTDEAPAAQRAVLQPGRYGDGWAPVLVAWSSPDEAPELRGRTAAYALPWSIDADGRGDRWVTGQVVLDRAQLNARSTPGVLLHELGHLAGLDHGGPGDTMHAHGQPGASYTSGALRGLHRLGLGPCAATG